MMAWLFKQLLSLLVGSLLKTVAWNVTMRQLKQLVEEAETTLSGNDTKKNWVIEKIKLYAGKELSGHILNLIVELGVLLVKGK